MAVLKCSQCHRVFCVPDDEVSLCTEAICGACFCDANGTAIGLGRGRVDSFAELLGIIEGNYGGIDEGRLARELADEYDDF